MEEFLLQAPIPGQSLTDEPKNFPWENPPEISDSNEALQYHIERLSNPEVLEDFYTLIELGYPFTFISGEYADSCSNGRHSLYRCKFVFVSCLV